MAEMPQGWPRPSRLWRPIRDYFSFQCKCGGSAKHYPHPRKVHFLVVLACQPRMLNPQVNWIQGHVPCQLLVVFCCNALVAQVHVREGRTHPHAFCHGAVEQGLPIHQASIGIRTGGRYPICPAHLRGRIRKRIARRDALDIK